MANPKRLILRYDINTYTHNTGILTQYYTKRQHKYFSNLINVHFATEQQHDTRYVTPTTIIPLAHIFIYECNPESDIETNTNTIQTHFDVVHIYEDNGWHLITIPKLDYIDYENNTNSQKTSYMDYNHPHNHLKLKLYGYTKDTNITSQKMIF